MAADDNKLVIAIELDDASVARGFAKIQDDGQSTFQKIGETAAGVFAGQAILGAISALKNSLTGLFDEAISSAENAGAAVQRLNTTLALVGRYSTSASTEFQDLADRLQATTTVSDDQVLSLEVLASTYAKTNTQALKLTKASIDFAAATGQDANTAALQLSATLSGQVGRLARLFPELKSYTKFQLEAGAAIDYFSSRFSGAAEAAANTFQGRVTQLTNAFDDLLKSLGKYVTESPTVTTTIKFLADEFLRLAGTVDENRNGADVFAAYVPILIELAKSINTYLIYPFETLIQVVNSLVLVFITGVKTINTAVSLIGDTVQSTLNSIKDFGLGVYAVLTQNDQLADELRAKAAVDPFHSINFDQTKASFDGLAKTATNAFNAVNGFGKITPVSTALDDALQRYQDRLAAVTKAQQEYKNVAQTVVDTNEYLSGNFDSFGQAVANFQLGFSDAVDFIAADSVKQMQEVGGNAFRSFSNSVSSGFAAIGKALVKGQDVFTAFAGALLSGLGQAAIQMGSFYILLGIARGLSSYGFDATAGGLIATGAALSVLGGTLAAFGDGVTGTSNPATSVATGGGSAISNGDTTTPANDPAQSVSPSKSGPAVTVVIQGSIYDTPETGSRIIDLINDTFASNGARITAV